MKRTILFFFFLILGLGSIAQSISVKSFRALPNDMDARQNYPEKDLNGDICAIIKIATLEKGFSFDIGSLGITKTEQKDGEIWIWIPRGAKRITITHKAFLPLRDYFFTESIQEGVCYELILVSGKVVTTVVEDEIKTIWFIVNSNPSGADVYINDKQKGVTPCTIKFPVGSYSYRLEKPFYNSDAGKFEITGEETNGRKEINLTLSPAFGYLNLVTEPENGASVFIDDIEQSVKTPFTSDKLKSGKHKVTVKKDMFQPKSIDVNILDGQTSAETITLSPNFANVSVNIQPIDADILVDGLKVSSGPFKGRILAGVHSFEGVNNKYYPDKKNMNILEGEDVIINLSLQPRLGNLDVMSTPIDADVSLNGQPKGKTPISLTKLTIGTYEVKIEKSGFESIIRNIEVKEGATAEINETFLNEQQITITSNPSNAEVFINSVNKGKTPLSIKLPLSSHAITLHSAGLPDLMDNLLVIKGKSNYHFDFNRSNEIALTIDGDPVTFQEIMSLYKKNSNKNGTIDKNSFEEYMNLYINFRLKVHEAEHLKMDTSKAFKNELNAYREKLSKPFLSDSTVTEGLLHEAYNRMLFDIRASHILIKVDKDASPADTMAAYNKISELRNRILKGGDFGKIAQELSDDPSARNRDAIPNKSPFRPGNKGDLGYFTVFDMVYPFENGAYNTEIGKVSKPIHTDFGYHIIKVTEKHPAVGTIEVAQIYVALAPDAGSATVTEKREIINNIYQKIINGMTFEDACRQFSEDKGSASSGGKLSKFTSNRIVPEFIEAIYNMPIGQVSAPIRTTYGYHIIKLLSTEKPGTFDQEKDKLKERLAKDGRSKKSEYAIILKIKKETNFTENRNNLISFMSKLDNSLIDGQFNTIPLHLFKNELFRFDSTIYTEGEFAIYISKNQAKQENITLEKYANKLYDGFVTESCLAYEDSQLEVKYPEFASLMKEYRDGILLFDITDQKVWTKAVKDEIGLKEFYNKNRSNYGQKSFEESKDLVTSDYQNFLENIWINELKMKYKVIIFDDVLNRNLK